MLTSPPMIHVMMLQRLLMLMMMMALPAVHARCRQQDRQKGRGKGGKTDRQTKTAGGRGGAGAIKGTKLDLLLSRRQWRLDSDHGTAMRRWRRAGVGVRRAVRVPAAGRDRRRARHLPGARRERGGRGTEGASQSESERLREGGRKKRTLATCPELAVRSSPSFARGVTTTESALPNRRRWWEATPPIIVTPLPE